MREPKKRRRHGEQRLRQRRDESWEEEERGENNGGDAERKGWVSSAGMNAQCRVGAAPAQADPVYVRANLHLQADKYNFFKMIKEVSNC